MTKSDLSRVFQALGDESRFKIMQILSQDSQLCVSEVATEVDISTAAVSQHMKVLEQAGLVKPRRQGQKICYRLVEQGRINKSLLSLIK